MPDNFVAAIDLGSNSFHMIVARIVDGHVQILDRLRDMVQLADGLDAHHRLSEESQQRALETLSRFGQRLRHLPADRLRIVGTNTLRQARNGAEFVARAEAVLGHKVEIVSGQEEARLIYLGVAHSVADIPGQRLVIDIGGGSTELIIGQQFDPQHLASLRMGCVSNSRTFFADGRIDEKRLKDAELLVNLRLEPIREEFRTHGWQVATGASGSIKAIHDVLLSEGWSRDGITLTALHKLRDALLKEGDMANIAWRWQLEPARARVFVGGFTILLGVCESLHIEKLDVSEGALREGLIYDMLGRLQHEDVRDRTIADVTRRFGLDQAQAERVSRTALELLQQTAGDWQLSGEEAAHLLERAARLHEIGMLLTHDQYHKHGAYVLQYSDLPGYSRDDQSLLAALVRRHRKSLPAKAFDHLPKGWRATARHLCLLLRLAVVLHRGRSNEQLPAVQINVHRRRLDLKFVDGWLAQHPLTRADLENEGRLLHKAGYHLRLSSN